MGLEYGSVDNYMRLAGEAFFKPSDESHYWPLGNVVAHKWNQEIQRKQHWKNERFGVRRVDREDVIGIDMSYMLTLDEEGLKEMLMLLIFGTALADVVQSSGTGATGTIASTKKRRWHVTGKHHYTNDPTFKVSSTTHTAGTDYILDKLSGLLYIPEASTIADASQLDMTLANHAAVTSEQYQALTRQKRIGLFELYESDGQSTHFRNIHRFTAELTQEGGSGDRGPEEFAKFDLRVRPVTKPIILREPIGTTEYPVG